MSIYPQTGPLYLTKANWEETPITDTSPLIPWHPQAPKLVSPHLHSKSTSDTVLDNTCYVPWLIIHIINTMTHSHKHVTNGTAVTFIQKGALSPGTSLLLLCRALERFIITRVGPKVVLSPVFSAFKWWGGITYSDLYVYGRYFGFE